MKKVEDFIQIGPCKIDSSASICKGAVIGKSFRRLLDGTQEKSKKTILCKKVYVGYFSIVGTGSTIGGHTIIDDYSIVESHVVIGKRNLVIYRAQICNETQIGNNCVIGGLIGERTIIADNCRIFGKIVHSQYNPKLGWDDDNSIEASPIIKKNAFIGFGSIVAGSVTIGRNAYVCAGAIITKDVKDFHIAWGINKNIHFSKWKGNLKQSPFFLAR